MASKERRESEDAWEGRSDGEKAESSDTQPIETAGAMADRRGKQAAGTQKPGGGFLVNRIAELITWKRPLYSTVLFILTNSVFWLVALSSWRVYYVLAMSLVVAVTVQMVRDLALSRKRGANLWRSMTESWEVIDSSQESRGGASQFTESWISCKLFLQEMSSFKQQNPGKFCLLVCSLCTFLAVLGRYIPGVVISYVLVLGIFLWPLLSSHEFGLWVEPVLQKLDFGVGDFLQKIRENHEKRILQRRDENSDVDLSALFPKLDSVTCRDLSISDTEVSEVTWTDNGTFNLSEEHTPQTENSDDLDRPSEGEEVFTGGLPDFPSLDNGTGTNGEDDDLSIGLPDPWPQPSHSRVAPQGGPESLALELMNRMAGDVIAAAVTAAVQEQLEAAVGALRPGLPAPLDSPEDLDSEPEDFELLDQSELEQIEGELGLERAAPEAQPKSSKPSSFLSSLLRRH